MSVISPRSTRIPWAMWQILLEYCSWFSISDFNSLMSQLGEDTSSLKLFLKFSYFSPIFFIIIRNRCFLSLISFLLFAKPEYTTLLPSYPDFPDNLTGFSCSQEISNFLWKLLQLYLESHCLMNFLPKVDFVCCHCWNDHLNPSS